MKLWIQLLIVGILFNFAVYIRGTEEFIYALVLAGLVLGNAIYKAWAMEKEL